MSIKEIAQVAGTSPSTVSRVLNNPAYECSVPGLRDKIWKTAMDLNYVPNEAARNLKRGLSEKANSYYINVLMTRTDASKSDPFFLELLRVVESEIHNNVCVLSEVWYMPIFSDDRHCQNANLDGIIQTMYEETERRSDGLIIIGKCNKEALKKLKAVFKNVVSVNRNSTNYEVDEVLCDGKKIASMAVEYLIRLGHHSIAYVGECYNEARYKGYIDTLRRHEIELDQHFVLETKQTEAGGFECMKRILQSQDRPTGIYCANDITAVGILKCLEKFKNYYYKPSVISSDDIEQAQNTQPMLSTVRLPKNEMGKFALYLLLDRIKGGHNSVVRMELEGKIIIRNSCMLAENGEWQDYCI